MRGGGGGGWTEGRTFINIHVFILNILNILCNIFPVFNARSCFNKVYFRLLDDTRVKKSYYYYYDDDDDDDDDDPC